MLGCRERCGVLMVQNESNLTQAEYIRCVKVYNTASILLLNLKQPTEIQGFLMCDSEEMFRGGAR